jgi:hypothetical protein
MIPVPNKDLPYLSATMNLVSTTGRRLCFHRAVALCLDLPGSEVVLGTVQAATPEEHAANPETSTEPFIHAWVEAQGVLMSPTTIEAANGYLGFMVPEHYYHVNGVTDIRRVTRHAIRRMCDKTIRDHLLYGTPTPSGYLVSHLLAAGGVKYKLSPLGGVLPA